MRHMRTCGSMRGIRPTPARRPPARRNDDDDALPVPASMPMIGDVQDWREFRWARDPSRVAQQHTRAMQMHTDAAPTPETIAD